jgi:limonene-1,2-epoxide hydrolase
MSGSFSVSVSVSEGDTTMATATSTIDNLGAAMESGDATRIAGCYTEDTVMQHPMQGTVRGRAAILAFEEPMLAAFSDLAVTASCIVEGGAGDWHAVEFAVDMTNTGPLPTPAGEVPATGRTVTLKMASLFRIDGDGLIVEERRYFDPMALFTQLGLA